MSGSTVMLLLRLGLSLGLVLGMIWGAARLLRSKGGLLLRSGGARVEVVERRALGKSSSVALVRVDNQLLVLGVGDTRVEVLLELPDIEPEDRTMSALADIVEISPAGPTSQGVTSGVVATADRPTFVEALREMTVRRSPAGTRRK